MVKLILLYVILLKVTEAIDSVCVFVFNLRGDSHLWLYFGDSKILTPGSCPERFWFNSWVQVRPGHWEPGKLPRGNV